MAHKILLKVGDDAAVIHPLHPLYGLIGRVTWIGKRSQTARLRINGRHEIVYIDRLAKWHGPAAMSPAMAYTVTGEKRDRKTVSHYEPARCMRPVRVSLPSEEPTE